MSFQMPITVSAVVEGIDRRKYLLPAIQREFVWKPNQMEELFDSIMRGYPIGSLLFWDVEPESQGKYHEGGTRVVGVTDDGSIVGVDLDIRSVTRRTLDGTTSNGVS